MVHQAELSKLQQFIQTQIFGKIMNINIFDPYPAFVLKQSSKT